MFNHILQPTYEKNLQLANVNYCLSLHQPLASKICLISLACNAIKGPVLMKLKCFPRSLNDRSDEQCVPWLTHQRNPLQGWTYFPCKTFYIMEKSIRRWVADHFQCSGTVDLKKKKLASRSLCYEAATLKQNIFKNLLLLMYFQNSYKLLNHDVSNIADFFFYIKVAQP